MGPKFLSSTLRSIASKIEASENPDKALVSADLKRVLASMGKGIKVRPAMGSSLKDAMEKVVEIPDRPALISYLQENYEFWDPTDENVKIEYYTYDDRTDWDTYIITVDGKAALFADGIFE